MTQQKQWEDEIRRLPAIEIFNHATLEMYHGGCYPDPDTFCGKCWELIKNDKPGERLIDWAMFEEDIEEIIETLNYQKADKKHPDYIFLSTKLTIIRARKKADLIEGIDYSEIEISALSLNPVGNRLEIPKDNFLSNYKELKEIMKNFEGKYKNGGFDFPYPAIQVLDRIRKKETTNLKKSFQYYGTPAALCDQLCEMTIDPYVNRKVRVLEPSAGQGGIIDAVYRWFEKNAVHVELRSITGIEFMAENFQVITEKYKDKEDIKLKHQDFLEFDKYINYYDYIIANPPFSGGQDILHIKKMYEALKPNGVLTCIMSVGWLYNSQKKFAEFRKWLGFDSTDETNLKLISKGLKGYTGARLSINGYDEPVMIQPVESGAFEESGTNVATCIVQIKKNDISGFNAEPVEEPKKKVNEKVLPKKKETTQLDLFK